MQICEASPGDIPALCVLINKAYRGASSRKGWTSEADLLDGVRIGEDILRKYFDEPSSVILKCLDAKGSVVACVYLNPVNRQLYLGMLAVDPELQAKGIGKLLLEEAEKRATTQGCTSIVITVISKRSELVSWYKRKGFVDTGERLPFPATEQFGTPVTPLELLLMQKDL